MVIKTGPCFLIYNICFLLFPKLCCSTLAISNDEIQNQVLAVEKLFFFLKELNLGLELGEKPKFFKRYV